MSVYDEARNYGFRLDDAFIEEDIKSNSYKNFNELKEKLLMIDLRRKPLLTPYFPDNLGTTHETVLKGNAVLQILSVVNICQPSKRKYEDAQPRILSFQLTDGHSKANAFEVEYLSDGKANLPPGTKVLLSGGQVLNGKILLRPSNFKFLGGEVLHLLEAWQANISALRFRSSATGSKNKSNSLSKGVPEPPQFELKLSAIQKADVRVSKVKQIVDTTEREESNSRSGKSKHEPRDQRREGRGKFRDNEISRDSGRSSGNRSGGTCRGRGYSDQPKNNPTTDSMPPPPPRPSFGAERESRGGGGRGRGTRGRRDHDGSRSGGGRRAGGRREAHSRGRRGFEEEEYEERGGGGDNPFAAKLFQALEKTEKVVRKRPSAPPPVSSFEGGGHPSGGFVKQQFNGGGGKDWHCSGCTYLNNAQLSYCEMCDKKR